MTTPTALHPRPQLTRPAWTDLSGPWGFADDRADVGLRQAWPDRTDIFDRTIVVPFPPENPASGVADTGPHPVVWYHRTTDLDRATLGLAARLSAAPASSSPTSKPPSSPPPTSADSPVDA